MSSGRRGPCKPVPEAAETPEDLKTALKDLVAGVTGDSIPAEFVCGLKRLLMGQWARASAGRKRASGRWLLLHVDDPGLIRRTWSR